MKKKILVSIYRLQYTVKLRYIYFSFIRAQRLLRAGMTLVAGLHESQAISNRTVTVI